MNHQDFQIRHFQPTDQQQVRQLILDGLGERFRVINQELNPDLNDIAKSYLLKNHIFEVVEFQGKIIGTGGLIFEDGRTGRLVRLSVSAQFRRGGIGRRMARHLIDLARQAQLERILVETNLDWAEAISLYRDVGFSVVRRDAQTIHFILQL